jgi:hypothetical protein
MVSNQSLKLTKNSMKLKTIFFLFLSISSAFAQPKAKNQKHLLSQYVGTWFSADKITESKIGVEPKIKMKVLPKMEGNSFQVEVFEWQNKQWQTIIVELISYDSKTDQIVAFGQDRNKQCFVGKGYFIDATHWQMNDTNFNSEAIVHVDFNFINANEVVLKGTFPNAAGGWDVKYIKESK